MSKFESIIFYLMHKKKSYIFSVEHMLQFVIERDCNNTVLNVMFGVSV